MDNWFKWNMFYTSFLPLWISIIVSDVWSVCQKLNVLLAATIDNNPIALRNIWDKTQIELVTIIILISYSVVGIFTICHFIAGKRKNSSSPIGKIVKARRANKLSAEFLLAYILPMIAFDFSVLHDVVLFLVYFSVLSFLCIRNNNVYTNFLFEAKGYRMYECDIECNVLTGIENKIYKNSLIISKNKTLANSLPCEIEYFDFDNYIYIDLEETEK
jgi:hypothetical protein